MIRNKIWRFYPFLMTNLKTKMIFIDRETMYFLLVKHIRSYFLFMKYLKYLLKILAFQKEKNEILHWVSIGRTTYQEISKIIGIKKCNIKFHMKYNE